MSKKSSSSIELNRTTALVVTLGGLLLVILFVATGIDPLGMFDNSGANNPTVVSPGSGGDWWQVYFTDPKTINDPSDLRGSIPEKLIAQIDNAQHSIDIAAFEFNLSPVADALIRARQRGVEVRWITDNEYGIEADQENGLGLFARMEAARIKIRDDGRSALMHNKFIIFDGLTVWTGSTNLTQNGNFRNNNNVIVIQSKRVADMYTREFDEMWEGKFGPTSPSTLNKQVTTVDGTPVQVLFAPEDQVVSQLIPLIAGAQHSIRFMAFSFTHDELAEAVMRRAQAGVDIQGIFEKRGSETEYSELSYFFCSGLDVRQDGNPGTFHHKVFVIDGQVVVTGSLNFSDNADNSNDENVIVVTHTEIAAQYLAEFERRWAEASPPEAAKMGCR